MNIETKHVAVVTGGASGIGHAVTEILTTRGWCVYVLDIRRPRSGLWIACDVRDYQSVKSSFGLIPHVDFLINSAGVFGLGESGRDVIRTNFLGTWQCARQGAQRGAVVVNVGSKLFGPGNQAPWHSAAYIMGKLAVNVFGHGWHVVKPGMVATPMTLQWRGNLNGVPSPRQVGLDISDIFWQSQIKCFSVQRRMKLATELVDESTGGIQIEYG